MTLFIVHFLHSPIYSLSLCRNILLSTLFSNVASPCSYLTMRNKGSHSYKTKGRIKVLYILIEWISTLNNSYFEVPHVQVRYKIPHITDPRTLSPT